MKKIDLYEVAIKVAGFYFAVVLFGQLRELLLYASLLIQSKNDPDSFDGINQMPAFLVVLFCFLALAAFTALLIFKTKTIAKWTSSKEDSEDSIQFSTDRKSIYEIALLLVGLLTILLALPDFIWHIKVYSKEMNSFSRNSIDANFLISDALKIGIGVLALLYAKPLASFFGKDKPLSKGQ